MSCFYICCFNCSLRGAHVRAIKPFVTIRVFVRVCVEKMQLSKSDMARSCAANATPVAAHVKIPFHLLRFSHPVCVYTEWNWPWQKWHRSADTTRHHVTWTRHGMLRLYTFSLLLLQHTQVAEGVFRSFAPVKATLKNIQFELTVQRTFSTERRLQWHDEECLFTCVSIIQLLNCWTGYESL